MFQECGRCKWLVYGVLWVISMVWLPYIVCVKLCGIDKMSQLTGIQGKHFPDHRKDIISCQGGDKVGGG